MVSEKPFMKIDNQIKQLRDDRGLLFNSEEHAHDMLTRYGYYEIINGYKDHFMIDSKDDAKGFISGTTFEHIFSLFELDRHLRESVMNSLELFESNLRQVLAYTIAEKISDNQKVYIDRKQYRTGKKYYDHQLHKEIYPVDKLIYTMNAIVTANTDPYKHYREHHGNVPPWILVKKLSFGNLIWWFKLLDSKYSDQIIARMMNYPESFVPGIPELRKMFGSLLTLYLNYRNTAAHGGRIYNHRSKKHALPYYTLLHKNTLKISEADYRNGMGQSQLGVVVKTLFLLDNKDPFAELNVSISYYCRQYLKQFPDDEQYLLTKMELDHDWIFGK